MKKTIAMLLAVVMVFALCACGGSAAPAAAPASIIAPALEAPAASDKPAASGLSKYISRSPTQLSGGPGSAGTTAPIIPSTARIIANISRTDISEFVLSFVQNLPLVRAAGQKAVHGLGIIRIFRVFGLADILAKGGTAPEQQYQENSPANAPVQDSSPSCYRE